MAVKIPDPLKRRHLVESPPEASKALALAEVYLEEGRPLEALLFLKVAGATDRLEAVLDEAVEEGDAFLVRETSSMLGRDVSGSIWRRVAEAATAQGKEFYAAEATRHADRLGY